MHKLAATRQNTDDKTRTVFLQYKIDWFRGKDFDGTKHANYNVLRNKYTVMLSQTNFQKYNQKAFSVLVLNDQLLSNARGRVGLIDTGDVESFPCPPLR